MAAIELPPYLNSRSFKLEHVQQLTPSGQSGFIQTLSRSEPFWRAEYSTPGLDGTRYNEMITFLELLEGSLNTFLAYDPRRPMPYAYRDQPITANPWGAPNATAYSYPNSTITLSGVAAGADITAGDYISFQQGLIWYLFRSTQTVTSSGADIVLPVKPRPNIQGALNVPVRYKMACCEMKMLQQYDERDSVDEIGPQFSFTGAQYVARAPT